MRLPLSQIWHLSLVSLTLCLILSNGCVESNGYPVITNLLAERDWVVTSGRCNVSCITSDIDGDSLTYTWSATGGTISGASSVAAWVAPDAPGTYTITVIVTDDKRAKATSHLTLDVRANHIPLIENIFAEPDEVRTTSASVIRCVASDPDGDELGYTWETTGGNISGNGSTVTWTAPDKAGAFGINVTVTDLWGAKTSTGLTVYGQANNPPAIDSLTFEPTAVRPGKTATLVCVASDPDGDELSYTWEAAEGDVSGTGSTVNWTAPNKSGTFGITVTVIDGWGGEVSKELNIKLQCG